MIQPNVIERIESLSHRIDNDTADLSDYNEYVDIVDDYYEEEDVQKPLRNVGVRDYAEFLQKRRAAKTYQEMETVEVRGIAVLLALGLALIISGILND